MSQIFSNKLQLKIMIKKKSISPTPVSSSLTLWRAFRYSVTSCLSSTFLGFFTGFSKQTRLWSKVSSWEQLKNGHSVLLWRFLYLFFQSRLPKRWMSQIRWSKLLIVASKMYSGRFLSALIIMLTYFPLTRDSQHSVLEALHTASLMVSVLRYTSTGSGRPISLDMVLTSWTKPGLKLILLSLSATHCKWWVWRGNEGMERMIYIDISCDLWDIGTNWQSDQEWWVRELVYTTKKGQKRGFI